MKLFDNVTDLVRDDLKQTIKRGSKVSIAAFRPDYSGAHTEDPA